MPRKRKFKVSTNSKKLAFFRDIKDCDTPPKTYFKSGTVVQVDDALPTVYSGKYGDKEYFKVSHPDYGSGYMLKEGLEEVVPNASS